MDAPSPEFLERFSAALVEEIKALRSRRGIPSSRQLGELLGEDPQWVSNRLDGGNPRTGKRVAMTTTDIVRIAGVLNTSVTDLMDAALAAAMAATTGPTEVFPRPENEGGEAETA
jgi:hypothetical protein